MQILKETRVQKMGGMTSWIFISTEGLMELDNTDTSKNHESMPVSDKDRTSTAPIHLEFSGMKPKLFSQLIKNNGGNKKKWDRINVNGSGENGKATGESGWKVFSRAKYDREIIELVENLN
jgi:hypothetical protein